MKDDGVAGWSLTHDEDGVYQIALDGDTRHSVEKLAGTVIIENWVKSSDAYVLIDVEALPMLIEALQNIRRQGLARLRRQAQRRKSK